MKGFYDKNRKTIWAVAGIATGLVVLALILPKRDTTGDFSGIVEDGSSNHNSNNIFDATSVANQLFLIMSDLGWFRSADILQVFADRVPRTNTAFESLKKAFGTRKHNQVTGGNTLGKNRGLIEWLQHEMNAEHYATLKSFYPNQPWI